MQHPDGMCSRIDDHADLVDQKIAYSAVLFRLSFARHKATFDNVPDFMQSVPNGFFGGHCFFGIAWIVVFAQQTDDTTHIFTKITVTSGLCWVRTHLRAAFNKLILRTHASAAENPSQVILVADHIE